jgi:hypothetical protein
MKQGITKLILFASCLFTYKSASTQNTLKVNAGRNANVCIGNFTTLDAQIEGGTPPYTVQWTPNEELADAASANTMVTPSFSTTYKIIVTDAAGQKARDEVDVQVFFKPTIQTTKHITIAPGETATLDVQLTDANGAVTYKWYPSAGLDNPTSNKPIASPNATTYYKLSIKDSKGCTATEQITIEVKSRESEASSGE